MATNKTIETGASVSAFVKTIADEKKRKDFGAIIKLVTESTGIKPKMWGAAIVGFGSYHYKYETGREGDAPLTALAARANSITLYVSTKFKDSEALLLKFGKHKVSGGCVHIKKLEDIDTGILIKIFKNTIDHRKKLHPCPGS